MDDEGAYLIWSHEHGAWWGPDGCGYVRSLAGAGRYGYSEAMNICTRAMPGTSARLGALPELPVREGDVLTLRDRFRSALPDIARETWE